MACSKVNEHCFH